MHVKTFYDVTAEKYDARHSNVRIEYMRNTEGELIKKFAFGKILDVGCGTGQHLKYGSIGIDISLPMLEEARKKGFKKIVQGSAEELPFKDESFDSVLCIFTVLNLCDYIKTIKEIYRVLKKNGIAIVSVASIWDHAKDIFFKRIVSARKSHILKMRIEGKRFRFFTFSKKDFVELFTENNFRLLHFYGAYMIAKPYWGWRRDFSTKEKIKLKTIFALERLLQPFNKTARMYFGVFRKKENMKSPL